MTKKVLYYIIAALVVVIFGLCVWYGVAYSNDSKDEPTVVEQVETMSNTTVENLIKTDAKYFDNMAGNIIFYESQVVLDKPFNEGDKFVAVEVTNVFQQTLSDGNGNVTRNVYEFKHVANYVETNIIVHKNASWLEDKPIVMDSLQLTFDDAYQKAKQSDLTPSKSRFMTLRNPLGPINCNPCYAIGNEHYGMMFVGAVDGDVTDYSPAFPKK